MSSAPLARYPGGSRWRSPAFGAPSTRPDTDQTHPAPLIQRRLHPPEPGEAVTLGYRGDARFNSARCRIPVDDRRGLAGGVGAEPADKMAAVVDVLGLSTRSGPPLQPLSGRQWPSRHATATGTCFIAITYHLRAEPPAVRAFGGHAQLARGIDGRPIRRQWFGDLWPTLRERAGLPDARFHDRRHTYGSVLLSGGVSVAPAAGYLGHGPAVLRVSTRRPRSARPRRHVSQPCHSDPDQGACDAVTCGYAPQAQGRRLIPLNKYLGFRGQPFRADLPFCQAFPVSLVLTVSRQLSRSRVTTASRRGAARPPIAARGRLAALRDRRRFRRRVFCANPVSTGTETGVWPR